MGGLLCPSVCGDQLVFALHNWIPLISSPVCYVSSISAWWRSGAWLPAGRHIVLVAWGLEFSTLAGFSIVCICAVWRKEEGMQSAAFQMLPQSETSSTRSAPTHGRPTVGRAPVPGYCTYLFAKGDLILFACYLPAQQLRDRVARVFLSDVMRLVPCENGCVPDAVWRVVVVNAGHSGLTSAVRCRSIHRCRIRTGTHRDLPLAKRSPR